MSQKVAQIPLPAWIELQKTKLLAKHPFYGMLLGYLKITPSKECGGIAATDGVHLYYDPDYWQGLASNAKDLVAQGLLVHEMLHCFPGGTFVAGADLPIDQVRPTSRVVGHDGRICEVVATSKRFYRGTLVTIKPCGLLPVDVTSEHPILTIRMSWKMVTNPRRTQVRVPSAPTWKPASAVGTSDWVLVPKIIGCETMARLAFEFRNPWSVPLAIRKGVPLDHDVAEFLGWYVAEGWATWVPRHRASHIGLALARTERHHAVRLQQTIKHKFGYKARVVDRGPSIYLLWGSAPMVRFLKAHCGSGAKDKRIPSFILYHKDPSLIRAFLKGYIAGDGFRNAANVGFGTASRTLAHQLQMAFARLGVIMPLHVRRQIPSPLPDGRMINSTTLYVGIASNARVHRAAGFLKTVGRPTNRYVDLGCAMATPITSVSRRSWSGLVYNLETRSHTYSAGNIITHNCALRHFWRRGDRDHRKWNLSGDLVIDQITTDIGLPLPDSINLGHEDYRGLTEEEIYATLPDQPATTLLLQGGRGGDMLITADGTVLPVDLSGLGDEWKDRVLAAAQAAKTRGSLPAGVQRMVDQVLLPKVDFRTILSQFATPFPADYDWRRPDRRYLASYGLVLPTLSGEQLNRLVIAADLSGSMGPDDIAACFGVVHDIMRLYDRVEATVMTFDARVHDVWQVSNDSPLPECGHGGGGTCTEPVFQKIEELDLNPYAAIILTDGHASYPDAPPPYPVLWVLTPDHAMPPWGEAVVLDEAGGH